MQVTHFSRFIAYDSSDVPSTPWQHLNTILETDSEIVKEIKKHGIYSYYTHVNGGGFIHRYVIAQ